MIAELLQKNIKDLPNLRLRFAEFYENESKLVVSFLYENEIKEDKRKEITDFISSFFNINTVELKFKKSFMDYDAVLLAVNKFIEAKYASIKNLLMEVRICFEVIPRRIEFDLICDGLSLINSEKFKADIKERLLFDFWDEFEIALGEVKAEVLEDEIYAIQKRLAREKEREIKNEKYISVAGAENYIGNFKTEKATPVSEINMQTKFAALCGRIKFFSERSYKKINRKTNLYEEKKYFTFTLDDGTGAIQTVYFCNKANLKKMQKLENGMSITARGDIEIYNDKLNFRPKDISLVEKFFLVKPEVIYKGVNENYMLIKPKPYVEEKQVGLFDEITTEEAPDEFFNENESVVLDVETTGLNYLNCEIIELAGVKIKKGRLTETFQTLIRPVKYKILPDTEYLTGITNELVKTAPTFGEIIADFFKWTDGCTLFGHNVDFDMAFLNYQAKEFGYYFDNPKIDTLELARKQLAIVNYKLGTVANFFGITNHDAHRALGDAITTAKVALKLKINK